VIYKRLKGEPLPPSRFSLGKAGLAVNVIGAAFLLLAFVMLFFPAAPHPDAAEMNWTILIYGSAIIFSLVYYYIYARHKYVGPVTYVRRD
jgi:choline transport protein